MKWLLRVGRYTVSVEVSESLLPFMGHRIIFNTLVLYCRVLCQRPYFCLSHFFKEFFYTKSEEFAKLAGGDATITGKGPVYRIWLDV